MYAQAKRVSEPVFNSSFNRLFRRTVLGCALGLNLAGTGALGGQLYVDHGTGSGEYTAGQTAYIAADATDLISPDETNLYSGLPDEPERIFDRWSGDTQYLADAYSPRTTLVMPAANVSVAAVYRDVSPWTIPSVLTYFPPDHKGVIFFLHGASGSASYLANNVLGERFIQQAVSRGYGVVMPQKYDDANSIWSLETDPTVNIDMRRVSDVRHDLINRGQMSASDPVYLVGVSAGGYFASLFDESAQSTLDFPVKVMVLMLSPGSFPAMPESRVPTLLAQAENDTISPLEYGTTAFNTLLARGTPVQLVVGKPFPVYPDYFISIQGVDTAASRDIYNTLQARGYLDAQGFLVEDPKTSRWEVEFPSMATDPELMDGVRSLLFQAYAEHSVMEAFTHSAFSFIENPVTRVDYPPEVDSFSPAQGDAGVAVTLKGKYFIDVQSVSFNGVEARFSNVMGDEITAYVPAGVKPGPIIVTNPAGYSTSPGNFGVVGGSAQVDGMTPTAGDEGTLVTITGTGLSGVSAVTFNGTAANFSQISTTKLTAVVPRGATDGPVYVVAGDGSKLYAGDFDVFAPPLIDHLSTQRTSLGASVSIYGSNLQETQQILLNNSVSAVFAVISDTEVVFQMPATGVRRNLLRLYTPHGSASGGLLSCPDC